LQTGGPPGWRGAGDQGDGKKNSANGSKIQGKARAHRMAAKKR